MSADESYDAIVVGAGMSGLCCAGELVLQGIRPLLISETKEVGFALRSMMLEGNRGMVQAPTIQTGWGGGWWPSLARRLNIPVRLPLGITPGPYKLAIEGTGEVLNVPQCCVSASALTSVLCELFPILAEAADEIERILLAAYEIPYPELLQMHRVPMAQWLEEQKADELLTQVFIMLTAGTACSTPEFCRENASVFGAIGALRSLFAGECAFGLVYPDHREGLAIPMAKEIEHRGGTVWRGRKVARVETDGGRVGRVVLEDGTEARAPVVAIASGNSRIRSLFDPLPPELEAPLAYSEKIAHQDFHVYAVLDKPVAAPEKINSWIGVLSPVQGMVQWIAPFHALAPWAVQPGKQFILSAVAMPADQVAERGGEEAITAKLHDVTEELIPGYKDAIGAVRTDTHKAGHLWYDAILIGPKVPRRSESVDGLWFVGEGSTPIGGLWMDGAASAGILGARDIGVARHG